MKLSRSRGDTAAARFAAAAGDAIAVSGAGRADASLAERVAAFVAEGDGEAVLGALTRAHPNYWTSRWEGEERSRRRDVYALLEAVPADAGHRWAQVVATFGDWGLTMVPVAGADWAELLLNDIAKCYGWGSRRTDEREPLPCTYAGIERIVIAGGGRAGELLAAAFTYPQITSPVGNSTGAFEGRRPRAYSGSFYTARALICALPDYSAAARTHADELVSLTDHPGKAASLFVDLLDALDEHALAPFAPTIVTLLTGSNVTVALAAEKLAVRCPAPELTVALRAAAIDGNTATQLRALRSLWTFAPGEKNRSWAVDFVATATSAAARALAREWADLPDDPGARSTGGPIPRRSGEPGQWQIHITDTVHAALVALIDAINAEVAAQNRLTEKSCGRADCIPLNADDLADLREILASTGPPSPGKILTPFGKGGTIYFFLVGNGLQAALTPDAFTLEATLTILSATDVLRFEQDGRSLTWAAVEILRRTLAADPALTLTRLRELLDQMGLPGNDLVFDAYRYLTHGLPAAAQASFVEANLRRFADELTTPPDYHNDRSTAYHALATLPSIPDDIADTMYRVALGTNSHNRELAQDTLAGHRGRLHRIHAALHDPDADHRIVAASWLGRCGSATDVEPLEAAYTAERTDRVSQAQLDALAALGKPASTYLNRETLTAAATKGMRKGPPALLAWIDWAELPVAHWAGTTEVVGLEIVQWLLTAATKLRTPEPTVALRYYCALFDPADAERLGDYLLDLWITVDNSDEYRGHSVSAIKCKGLLAICAATCADNAAPMAEHEIRSRYGTAAAQCRALLGMLSWVDRPNAIAVILAIATRFRTKGIQLEAQKQVDALAARRGWTRAELADRTVPDAGFDTDGRLTLSYGPRSFTARIGADLKLYLAGPDGTPIKSLPAARVADDPGAVTSAKKDLAAARKAVKTLIPQQVGRLEEALYAHREWSVPDWERYLHGHPIVAILCRRLIWAELDADGAVRQTFRPLDDGTLTDVDDEEVTLGTDTRITLAHTALTGAATGQSWADHLRDYAVTPLFTQFHAEFVLPESAGGTSELPAFEGYLIDAFALRSMARKLGYTRGETGDGGVFFDYVKTYPALGLTAVLGFSGNQLPEENLTVALTEMTYLSIDDQARVPLRDVPILLLAAGHRDLTAIAAAGSGHAPDWRSKVAYA